MIPLTATGSLIGLGFRSSNIVSTETTSIGTSSISISYSTFPCRSNTLTKYSGV
ncbi:MAG: hypothetical protein VYC61_01745 [Candidatus Neomarinimicrobiota bacterium]|jgi:hypothetical protein|nr:hypothetical protein [Candidatus Neomarinimicrobiota bacterium]MEE3152879.1 hypothetical protein [Candidatus Neomarinimicrobiota bacterium]